MNVGIRQFALYRILVTNAWGNAGGWLVMGSSLVSER